MTVTDPPLTLTAAPSVIRPPTKTYLRVTRYSIVRMSGLFVGVAVAVYLTILVANMGGYVDEIIKGNIRDAGPRP